MSPWFGVPNPKQQAKMILNLKKKKSWQPLDGNTTYSSSMSWLFCSLSHTHWRGHVSGHRHGGQLCIRARLGSEDGVKEQSQCTACQKRRCQELRGWMAEVEARNGSQQSRTYQTKWGGKSWRLGMPDIFLSLVGSELTVVVQIPSAWFKYISDSRRPVRRAFSFFLRSGFI